MNENYLQGHEMVEVDIGPAKQETLATEQLNEEGSTASKPSPNSITYGIEDKPPLPLTFFLAFQHFLTMFGSTLAVPLVLFSAFCLERDLVAQSEVIGTTFFVSGVATLIQTTIGIRLPIVQGCTFAFLAPTFSIMSLRDTCEDIYDGYVNQTEDYIREQSTAEWQSRIQEIQGAIMVASIFQVLIGFSGIMGVILHFIGPLAITPTIALIGLSLFSAAAEKAGVHWGIAFLTIALITLFSQYIYGFNVPCPSFSSSEKKCGIKKSPIFKLLPVILGIALAWLISSILTAAGVFPEGHGARTDARIEVLKESAWFRFPYPGQWGTPSVSVAGVFGMLAGVIASMIESLGDYFACARLAGAPPPPPHAINRGIGIEGIGCILAGAWGSGNGTTSYSENIGAIGITKVGSRFVVQVAAIMMIFMGTFGKFGAVFVAMPDPIVGGVFCIMFGMITGVGLSNLQFVDLNSSRNIFIVGFAFLMGLAVPSWITGNSGVINTGVTEINQIIEVLLKTSMFVGGFIGFILDNTIPGTAEERGIKLWRQQCGSEEVADNDVGSLKSYDIPLVMEFLKKHKAFEYMPFLPTFKEITRRKPQKHSRKDSKTSEILQNA
ncbi:solute carrier family 23 member 2-like [Anneissia japonica]|uniref:solute carrier family 23 member 2-like n=1 Tax=Anneissia japonica TaxID=1529436 RepID=UPI0014259AC3|nr:solute carrier family 23 member 2-like [Anneissia japonica]